MRNRLFNDNDILQEAQNMLIEWLPNTWLVKERLEGRASGAVADMVIDIEAPDGGWAQLVVEAKQSLDPKDAETAINQALRYAPQNAIPFIEAPYLSERTRERLRKLGAGFIDLTGNAYLRIEKPAVFIERSGASKNPWRVDRPARTLKGPKAARLVRALVDFSPPRGIRELAQIAGIDPGYTSRLLSFLEREDLITREKRGPVEKVNWPELLKAWARDYSLTKSNAVYTYLQPRGLNAFLEGIRTLPVDKSHSRYAITGSLAASRRAPVAPARLGACYVESASKIAEKFNLVPTESGANVLLVEPFDSIVFERTTMSEGLVYVAPSQAVADLLSGSGRMPEEGEAFLGWMQSNEEKWRAS